uniref:mucin-13-like n=1 Tax=Myxine glutinosa TaxID=7769 RepID=UPI00358E77D9
MALRGVFFSLLLCFVICAAPAGTSTSPPITTSTPEPATTTLKPTTTTTTTPGTTSPTITSSTPEPTTTTLKPTTTIITTITTAGSTTDVTSGNTSTSTLTTPAQAVCHMNQQKSTYWCECPVGYNLTEGDCISVKAFTSMLHWDDIFTSQMNDKTSKDFKRIENETKTEFDNVYWNISGYIGVEVLQISKGSVKVLTSCMFNKESKMNDALFNNLLGQINDSSIEQYNICDLDTCDKQTTSCLSKDGIISCNCNDGHVPSKYSQRSCLACEPGKKAANNKCEACPFGYSGVNCNDVLLVFVSSSRFCLVLLVFVSSSPR